jgi:PAS domain S-box-containing protein
MKTDPLQILAMDHHPAYLETLRAGLEAANVGKSLTLPGGKLQVNQAFAGLLGYSLEELKDKTWQELTPPEEVAEVQARLDPLLRGEQDAIRFRKRYVHKDGSHLWADVSVTIRRTADGEPLHFITTLVDITEQRRAEEALQRLLASLAQSDRMSSLGMLAAGVAHELNNPLAYVLFNLESLAEDLPGLLEAARRCHAELTARAGAEEVDRILPASFCPEKVEDALDRLREACSGAQRIRQIAGSLSTFSRVERKELGPVDVEASLDHALTLASNELKYRARVVRDFAGVPRVLATESKLAQVFLNLLLNAAQAIDEGQVARHEIRVRTSTEGERVCVEVSDTGRGIAPEHQARLFEPVFTPRGVGSGLGLSICKSIVTEFGGEIAHEGAPGGGARFRIRLPGLPGGPRGSGEPAPASLEAPGVRGRILVVDDEAGIRASLVRLLGREHELVAVASGEEARALLEADRCFDLVLCDLMMPRMSGMELHAWLARADPGLAGRVVFLTGGAFTPGAAEYLARVGNLRVEKPFESKSLRKLAGDLVRAARDRDEG